MQATLLLAFLFFFFNSYQGKEVESYLYPTDILKGLYFSLDGKWLCKSVVSSVRHSQCITWIHIVLGETITVGHFLVRTITKLFFSVSLRAKCSIFVVE